MSERRHDGDRERLLVLLVDTSASMTPVVEALRGAVRTAVDSLSSEPLTPHALAVAVVAAGSPARVVHRNALRSQPSDGVDLEIDGDLDLPGALGLLTELVEEHSTTSLTAGHGPARPWVVVLTDGRWGDRAVRHARDALQTPPTRPDVLTVGVADVDETALGVLATTGALVVDSVEDLEPVLLDVVRQVAMGAEPSAVTVPPGSRALQA